MDSNSHFPNTLFDNEKVIAITVVDELDDLNALYAYQPEIVIVSLNDHKPENSLQVQQKTMERLRDSLEKNGKKAGIIYCSTNCFIQQSLEHINSIRTIVFLGVKPFNVEVLPLKFYSRINWQDKIIIVGNTIYQMEIDAGSANPQGFKRKLWEALIS